MTDLARSDTVARATLARLLRSHRLPPGLERADALVIARVAAWSAAERYDPAKGASWETWVIGRTREALLEIWRSPKYGAPTRAGYSLQATPLDDALTVDPSNGFAAAEARLLLASVRRRCKPRHWAALVATVGYGQTLTEYGDSIGVTDTRVYAMRQSALGVAREVLEGL